MQLLSANNIVEQARGSKSTFAGDVNIIANSTNSTTDETPLASPEGDTPKLIDPTGNLNFISYNAFGTSLFQFQDGNFSVTYPKDGLILSEGAFRAFSENAVQVARDTYIQGSNGNTTVYNGQATYISTIPYSFPSVPPPNLTDLPSFPKLPKFPKEELEACIPDKYKKNKTGTEEDTTLNGPPLEDTLNGPPLGETNGSPVLIDPPTLNNPVNPSNDVVLESGDKLPSNTVSNSIKDLYKFPWSSPIDVYTKASLENTNLIFDVFRTRETVDELDEELATLTIKSSSLFSEENVEYLISTLQLPTDRVSELVAPLNRMVTQAFSIISETGGNLLLPLKDKTVLEVSDFSQLNDLEDSQIIVDFLNDYPESRNYIFNNVVLIQEAVGFFGASLLAGPLSSVIGKITNIGSIGLDNIGESVLNIGKEFLKDKITSWVGSSQFSFLLNTANQFLSTGSINTDTLLNDTLNKGLDAILPEAYTNLSAPLTNLIFKVSKGESIELKDEILSLLRQATPLKDVVAKGEEIYNFGLAVLEDYKSEDLTQLLTGGNLQALITSILGQSNNQQIQKIFNIIEDGLGVVEAINSLPDLLKLMEEYDIPVLDQISTALNCLDLFDRISDLLVNFKGDSNRSSTARTLENLPRVIQAANSINQIKFQNNNLTVNGNNSGINSDINSDIDNLSPIELNLNLSRCFKLPKLTVAESTVLIDKIEEGGFLYFSVPDLLSVQRDIEKNVSIGDFIHISVDYFIDGTLGQLYPYQTDTQYTKSVYKYYVYEYDLIRNLGIASLYKESIKINLINETGIIYQFPIEAVGTTLTPVIKDVYLNK